MKAKAGTPPLDVESILKSVESLSIEDKVTKLAKRLAESEELNNKLKEKTAIMDKLQKANTGLEKKLEKNNFILLRTEEAKSKLEELCRELQKYNKQVRDESINKIKALETERQTAVEQLKVTLQEIEKSMSTGRERSDALANDNKRLAEKLMELGSEYENKLKAISDEYMKKDVYYNELKKAKDVEVKLAQTKLEAALLNNQKLLLEKEELTRSLLEGSARVGSAIESERALRAEVQQYSARYDELTKSLSTSNTAFDKFKKEILKVNSNLKKMENDALKWKQKYEESSKNVLVLTMGKKEVEDALAVQAKKVAQLEQLCRALSERKAQEEEKTTSESKAE